MSPVTLVEDRDGYFTRSQSTEDEGSDENNDGSTQGRLKLSETEVLYIFGIQTFVYVCMMFQIWKNENE